MKAILIPFLSLLIPLTPQSAFAQSEPELKLESVVIVSRHGVRAPTKATQLMQDVTPDAWPTWPVKLGWLTPRGGELIAYLGHYQRQRLVADGLLAKKGCPQSGQVAIIADVDERTRKTGEAFAAGLAPDCAITVHTQADTSSPDPLFNPLKTGVCQLDNALTRSSAGQEGQLLTLPGIGKRRFANWNGCLIFRNQTCALNVRNRTKAVH